MDFLKKLFGGGKPAPPPSRPAPKKPAKPPLPKEDFDGFTSWFTSHQRPAVRFIPAPDREITEQGSRLGGPVWLAEGEEWPVAADGVPLEFVFQLDCADCATLDGYPEDMILQFFIGRSDLYGFNFDELVTGDFLIHARQRGDTGRLHAPPLLAEVNGEFGSDYSPFGRSAVRGTGVMVDAQPFTDTIDGNSDGVYDRIYAFIDDYDLSEIDAWLDVAHMGRGLSHHTGGYPAFTQADITATPAGQPFDHVLLRLTSDDTIMWGDSGECVFLIRSEDLRKGDFSRVAYSWDCC